MSDYCPKLLDAERRASEPISHNLTHLYQHTMLDLAGAKNGPAMSCTRGEECSPRMAKPEDMDPKKLYEEFHLLKSRDDKKGSGEFDNDLTKLNAKLSFWSPMKIVGLDDKAKDVLFKGPQGEERFKLVKENDLITFDYASDTTYSASTDNNPDLSKTISDGHYDYKSVKQNVSTDCYFMATLAAVAATTPEALKGLITESSPHKFKVSFAGNSHPVEISEPNAAELKLFNDSTKVDWSSIAEKAHRALDGTNAVDPGNNADSAMALLTNKFTSSLDFTSKNIGAEEREKQIDRKLTDAVKDHRPMVAGSGFFCKGDDRYDGIMPGHFYTVLGYDPETKMVHLRNPVRLENAPEKFAQTAPGEFSMPLDKFARDFDRITTTSGGV